MTMKVTRKKPVTITLEGVQHVFLKRMARAQQHGNVSLVIRRLVDREMGRIS